MNEVNASVIRMEWYYINLVIFKLMVGWMVALTILATVEAVELFEGGGELARVGGEVGDVAALGERRQLTQQRLHQ